MALFAHKRTGHSVGYLSKVMMSLEDAPGSGQAGDRGSRKEARLKSSPASSWALNSSSGCTHEADQGN